jgi:glucose uptake protein
MSVFFALMTVLAWGMWLIPSQAVTVRQPATRTFYVTLAVLLSAVALASVRGWPTYTGTAFAGAVGGGAIWAASSACAFLGARELGLARAFGLWAPLNVVISLVWGGAFGEFAHVSNRALALGGIGAAMLAWGVRAIAKARPEESNTGSVWRGYLGALGASLGFASYFVPIRAAGMSGWDALFPLGVGMVLGASLLAVATRAPFRLAQPNHYARLGLTGALWAIGNVGALLTMEKIGTGRGFAVAQLCVAVNAVASIVWLRDPIPGSPAARRTLVGVGLATAGGLLLSAIPL